MSTNSTLPRNEEEFLKTEASRSASPSLGELVAKITAQFSALVRDEIMVAKLNAKAKVTKLGVGGVLMVVAAVLALYMLGILLLAAGYGIATVLPTWAAFLIVAGVLLVIILVLVLVGVAKFKASANDKIDPKSGITEDIQAIKKGIQK